MALQIVLLLLTGIFVLFIYDKGFEVRGLLLD